MGNIKINSLCSLNVSEYTKAVADSFEQNNGSSKDLRND
jgi:hypothetical protein